jgi:RHS repeat-associated protein
LQTRICELDAFALTGEYQEHTGAVNTTTSPEVQYADTEMAGGVNNSRPTGMTYPNGRKIDFVYNTGLDSGISRISAIADDSGGTTLEGYSDLGLDTIVQRAHPEPNINLSDIQQTGESNLITDGGDQYTGLDRFGRVVDQNYWNPTSHTSTDRFQYGYDRVGETLYKNNLVNSAQSELYRANSTQSGDSNTAYDPLGRQVAFARGTLSSSGHNGTQLDTIATASRSQSWSLDALGNWSSVTTNGTATTRTFNAQDQTATVSGGTAPTYDHDGNTIGDAGLTYVYDAWDRLVTAKNGATTVAAYAYDALGRRVSETYSGTSTTNHLYYSSAWQDIEERLNGTGSSNVSQQYVWGLGGVDSLVLRDSYSGGVKTQRLYAQQDANGDVTALINTSGVVQERYLYDPYGSVTVTDANYVQRSGNQSSFGWQFLFQAGRLDAVTGWYAFRNRDLIPSEGRWAERDPWGLAAGDPNIYRFVENSPTAYIDPFGLDDDTVMGMSEKYNAKSPSPRSAPVAPQVSPPSLYGLEDNYWAILGNWRKAQRPDGTWYWVQGPNNIEMWRNDQFAAQSVLPPIVPRPPADAIADAAQGKANLDTATELAGAAAGIPGRRRLAVPAPSSMPDPASAKPRPASACPQPKPSTPTSPQRSITPGTGSKPVIRPGPNSPVQGPPGVRPAPNTNPPKVNMGRQGKHIPGHNNYQPGKSILRADPEELARQAGTGRSLRDIPVGQPGSREMVDFGKIIGDHIDEVTGAATPTRWGVITYGKDGIHIFPVRPQ